MLITLDYEYYRDLRSIDEFEVATIVVRGDKLQLTVDDVVSGDSLVYDGLRSVLICDV